MCIRDAQHLPQEQVLQGGLLGCACIAHPLCHYLARPALSGMGAKRTDAQAGQKRAREGSASAVPPSPLPTSPRSLNRQAKLQRLLKQLHSQAPGADEEDSLAIEAAAAAAGAGHLGPLGDGTAGAITGPSSRSGAGVAQAQHNEQHCENENEEA